MSREAEDASFDWFKKYEDLKPLINRFVPDKTGRVCMLGCGNSSEWRALLRSSSRKTQKLIAFAPAALSRDMYDDGYTKIENIDYSSVVIDKMAKLNEARIGMNCECLVSQGCCCSELAHLGVFAIQGW